MKYNEVPVFLSCRSSMYALRIAMGESNHEIVYVRYFIIFRLNLNWTRWCVTAVAATKFDESTKISLMCMCESRYVLFNTDQSQCTYFKCFFFSCAENNVAIVSNANIRSDVIPYQHDSMSSTSNYMILWLLMFSEYYSSSWLIFSPIICW